MAISNYPNGFPDGVAIRGVPVLNLHAGNVFWVNSAIGGDGNKGTREKPFATLDYAISRCTANNGDVIIIAPNHAETITGAGGITADVAGITIVGMGRYNQRPRFLMDGGTAVTFVVSAADVTVMNMVFAGGHDGIVRCFNITATGFTARDIEFEDNTTNEHFLVCFGATGGDGTANGLTIDGCKRVTVDSGATDFLSVTGDLDSLTFTGNTYIADAATGAGMILCATGKDLTGLVCMRNVLICGNTAGDLLIDNDTAVNTGVVAYNFVGHHDTAGAVLTDCDGVRLFENYSASDDTTQGVLHPAADTVD